MTEDELNNIENYLNKTFKTNHFEVKKRKSIEDSCEIYLEEEL